MAVWNRRNRYLLWVIGVALFAASCALAQTAEGQTDKVLPRPAGILKVDPLLIAEAGEVWALIAAPENPVWPGWNAAATPLLFYLPGEQDVLINHPHPSGGFLPYDGPVQFPGGRIMVKDGPTLIEWDGQNTSQDVEGVRTLIVADRLSNLRVQVSSLLMDEKPAQEKVQALQLSDLATDPYDQLAMVVHEAFHVFQDERAPDKGANEMLLLSYPVLSVQNNTGFALEGAALARALRAGDDAEFRRAAVRWLAVRKDRRSALPREAVDYEDGIEFTEGLAKHTEYRLFQVLEGRRPGPAMAWAQGFAGYADLTRQRENLIEQMVKHMSGEARVNNDPYGTAPLRMRLYFSGMAEGVVLDRLSPGWKDRIFLPEATLTSLIEGALKASPSELGNTLKEAKGEAGYGALVEKKTVLAREGRARAEAMLKEIESGPGIGFIVDHSALDSTKPAMSFTPFGITVIDAERTIFTMAPIAVAFGKDGQVAQTVPAPLLRDTKKRIVKFRLPPGATRAEVEKALGSIPVNGDAVAPLDLALPGAIVKGATARVKWIGEDLVVILQKSAAAK
jgi:hypothetical protein